MTTDATTTSSLADDKSPLNMAMLKEGGKLVTGGILTYVGLTIGGVIAGGILGAIAGPVFGLGALATVGTVLLGLAVGAAGGFFGAQAVVMGKVEDFALKHGLKLAGYGLGKLGKELKHMRENKPAPANTFERGIAAAAGALGKGATSLSDTFAGKTDKEMDGTVENVKRAGFIGRLLHRKITG